MEETLSPLDGPGDPSDHDQELAALDVGLVGQRPLLGDAPADQGGAGQRAWQPRQYRRGQRAGHDHRADARNTR
jgi:hypothetical protein